MKSQGLSILEEEFYKVDKIKKMFKDSELEIESVI